VRVALVCPYDWDAPGGVQVHVRELASHLRGRGHAVLVLAPARTTRSGDGLAVVGRPYAVRFQGSVAPIAPGPSTWVLVGTALRTFAPDVVHVHEPMTPSTSMAATLRAKAPVVATFHAYAERSRLYSGAAAALRPVWRRLAVRIAVSEAAREFVTTRFAGEVRIIPNGVDVGRFASPTPMAGLPEGRRIVWVGRLDPQKGFPVAVEAFSRLAEELPDVWFVVAGDGRDREALKNVPGPVRARVRLLGPVPSERVPGALAGADVFVSPALGQESFGITLVEAMAAGVAVVATDIAGYREVVRAGVDGLLVPPGDPGEVANALRRVLEDPSLADRLRAAGRQRAARFDWETVAGEVEEAYRDSSRATPP
jgi:phosphatidylinositol alpha-mannosyltransferase